MLLLMLVILPFSLAGISQWKNKTFAVVEYQPYRENASLFLNDINYIMQVFNLEIQMKLDLIVFPEDTLMSNVSEAVEVSIGEVIEIGLLKTFSEVSKLFQTYMVLNIIEKEKCQTEEEDCPTGFRFYNTDVAFNRNGSIAAKYRKFNLYGEIDMTKPAKADRIILETDFPAKLGIFTCFDILFKNPAQDLVELDKIDGAIFPSMWYGELPFLTSLQVQQMWSHRHDIPLFAAGANNPELGSGGSGIYDGVNGALVSNINAKGGTETIFYPDILTKKSVSPIDMDNFKLKKESTVQKFASKLLDISKTHILESVPFKTLTCNFDISIKNEQSNKDLSQAYTYHLVAYSGLRSFDSLATGGIEVCAVIACLTESVSSCGERFPQYDQILWPVSFTQIKVTADFDNTSGNRTQYPNSLLSSIKPIAAEETKWTIAKKDDKQEVTFSINKEQKEVLTFGIYGRNFGIDGGTDEDDDNNNNNTSSGEMIQIMNYLLMIIIINFINLMI